ncbi:MAG: NAD(P)H-quinone oxidoreductase [Chloroflexi bacterium]|nr:NAD(P)H-quinone oxidoreductase [Chloroflexota bacterium]
MKAIVVRQGGGPEVLRLEDVPTPEPGPGEILIEVMAAGGNYGDTGRRRGTYNGAFGQPFTPGSEVAGVVAARGPGVNAPAVGTRVMSLVPGGGYAQFAIAPADIVLPIPENLDEIEGAAIPLQGITAYHALRTQGHLQQGETVLIHAAGGGVGTLAVQLARLMGAGRIIATASNAAKLELARTLGATHTINYATADFVPRVLEITDGVGADLIIEAVGGGVTAQNLTCLAPFGRLVIYGSAGGPPAAIDPRALMAKNQTFAGFLLGAVGGFTQGLMKERRDLMHRAATDLFGYLITGRLRPIIGHELPLSEAPEAHRIMESRGSTGKIVLTVS